MDFSNINIILEHLCSKQKLERDKALEELLKVTELNADKFDSILSSLESHLEKNDLSWETSHGVLLAISKIIILPSISLREAQINEIREHALKFLVHEEVRVRLAAGEVLGNICVFDECKTYAIAKSKLFDLILSNLNRNNMDKTEDSNSDILNSVNYTNKDIENGHRNSQEVLHDTAGWSHLESSLKCLECMIHKNPSKFEQFINQELLDLIFKTLEHVNRFVRETGFSLLSSLLDCGNQDDWKNELNTPENKLSIAQYISKGVSDNWSQVRFSASVTARKFLLKISKTDQEKLYAVLLPKICLNRYYVAEGVRIYSQDTWCHITKGDGRALVKAYIKDFVSYYNEATAAENHAVREAACTCISEMASKIEIGCVAPHVPTLLEALIFCFNDDSWAVRDAACVASGSFIECFPTESEGYLARLLPLFFSNLEDNIPSVRRGAAVALVKVIRQHRDLALCQALKWIEEALEGLSGEPESSLPQSINSCEENLNDAQKMKELTLHTNQQMYSCGSLAPKFGRGKGGCSDSCFRRPVRKWEKADGATHLLAELSSVAEFSPQVQKLLPLLSSASSLRHYSHHLAYLESFCKAVSRIAKGLGKKPIKPFLSLFYDSIFYALKCDNELTSLAAEQCIKDLSILLGPNILRGRLEDHNILYTQSFDDLVSDIQ